MQTCKSILCTACAVLLCVSNIICATRDVEENQPKVGSQKSRSSVDDKNLQAKNTDGLDKNARNALLEALANKLLRDKFKDAMPMLRGLSPEQSAGFYALLTERLSPKSAHKEELAKATQLFGSKKSSAVLSLVHEVSKFLETSANNFNGLEYNVPSKVFRSKISVGSGLKEISTNDDLIKNFEATSLEIPSGGRQRRSARLLHKLIRIPPPNCTDDEIELQTNISPDIKLNTSSFAGPYSELERSQQEMENSTVLPYEQIENLALADLNGTDIEPSAVEGSGDEVLPNPEELVAGPRYRHSNKHRVTYVKGDSKRKRIPVRSHQIKFLHKQCERFTASMCIKTDDYPIDQIMGSIRRHKNAMSALLAEYRDKAAELEYQEQLEEYQFNSKRREDGSVITPGGMCASVVRYARPQKARSASGEWKYIVNTGRHTQTLRLEKCSTPQESCSYLSHNYRSRCTQVYNYHRLLSWDKTRGLHVDIFKVPSCCSCQVDGYRETFPPLGGTKHKGFTPVPDNNPYISINDEIDYEDDDDEDPASGFQYHGGFDKNKLNNFQHSELLLESKNIKTKVNHPNFNPTVGSYLSPPEDVYDTKVASKTVRPTYYTQTNKAVKRSRKPFKNFTPNESRVDVGIPGDEEFESEVKSYENARVPQKRKRLYSGQQNLENTYQTSGPFISSDSVASYVPTSGERVTTTSYTGIGHIGTNSNNKKEVVNGKRINYNYHPIIDFFENHQKSVKGPISTRNAVTNTIPISAETSTIRDRRIGYGMEGAESNWHPVVVKS